MMLGDMKAGKQETMSFDQAIPKVIELLGGKDSLDTYTIKDKLGGYKQDVE